MIVSEKIKTINNKIEQNMSKDVLPKIDLLQKVAALKRFEYSPFGSELKKQTSVAEKQYQGLNKLLKSDEKEEPVIIKKEKPAITSKS